MQHAARVKRNAEPAPSRAASDFLFPLLILALSFIAFAPAIRGDFIWDDHQYLSENKNVAEPGGLVRTWTELRTNPQYYPLVFTTYWIEHQLWGLNTPGYHITNILLHAATAILLGRLLSRWRVPGAWLAAMLFAVHPVQVETVAWITERKNTLSGLFYLLSLTYFSRFAALDEDKAPTPRNWSLFAVALACFVGALLSKTVTATLPAVLLLIVWWRRGRIGREDILALIPMFVLGIAFGLMTAYMEQHHVGAKGEEWNLSMLERGLLAGRAVWFYAAKLVWPYPTMFVYPRWVIDAGQAWQFAFPVAAIGLIVVLWVLRGRIGRGPLVAAMCFGGTLFPAIGFLNVFPHRYSFVADHFQYHASVFGLTLIAAVLAIAAKRIAGGVRGVIAVAAVLVLTALSFNQSKAYYDLGTLWQDTIAKNDGAWMAHGNLGDWYSGQDKYAEAIPHYEKSLAMRPQSEEIHFNLALALQRVNRRADAMAHYREAIRLVPTYAKAHINIGAMMLDEGKAADAIPWIDKGLELDATLVPGHYARGNALARLGRNEEARRAYAEAMRLQPDFWEAWINDANLLWAMGRRDEAINQYREVTRRNPRSVEAFVNLGSVLMQKGDTAGGVAALREAVKVEPRNAAARIRLAQALVAGGNRDEAAATLEAGKRIDPKNADIAAMLNELLATPPQ